MDNVQGLSPEAGQAFVTGSSPVKATLRQQIRWFLERLGKTTNRQGYYQGNINVNLDRRGFKTHYDPKLNIELAVRDRFGEVFYIEGTHLVGPGISVPLPPSIRQYVGSI
jgi:hypothetical protein